MKNQDLFYKLKDHLMSGLIAVTYASMLLGLEVTNL